MQLSMNRDEEFWIQTRSVQYASDIPVMLERMKNPVLWFDGSRWLEQAWNDANPGTFFVASNADEQVNKMADDLHLDVIQYYLKELTKRY